MPVPNRVRLAKLVLCPSALRSIVPEPLLILSAYAPLVFPTVMVPLELLVKVVATTSVFVLDVPLRSIAPTALMALVKVLLPDPCNTSELIGVVPPNIPPKLIAPLPALTVNA
ncbi:hypothetical protein POBR111598_09910 [Polynucleobacter brandtiae]